MSVITAAEVVVAAMSAAMTFAVVQVKLAVMAVVSVVITGIYKNIRLQRCRGTEGKEYRISNFEVVGRGAESHILNCKFDIVYWVEREE